MGPTHRFDHRGHRFEVAASRPGSGTTVHLLLDGRRIAERPAGWTDATFALADLDTGLDLEALDLGGATVRAASAWRSGRVGACTLLLAGSLGRERLPFEPPPGTWAHRGYAFRQAHPRWHAARHVAVAAVQVAIALLGLLLALDWIPWGAIPWPDWRLPRLDLPSIPWPDLPGIPWPDLPTIPWPDWHLPDLQVPGWVRTVLGTRQYWLPLVIALAVAAGELERRRRRQAREAAARVEQEVRR